MTGPDAAVTGQPAPVRERGSRAVRVAAGMYLFLGVAFGASVPVVLSHLARHGELPMSPFGWRYMAGRPVEQLRPDQFIALGWALVGVCALDVVAGIWLWQGRSRGLKLGLATTAPALVLGAAFELPLLLVGVPIRAALALAGRRALR
jgi:hypothetical protein